MAFRPLAAAALLLLFALPRPAQAAAPRAIDPLRPERAATAPVIDGDLSDAIWKSAPHVTGFKTWMPDYGKDAPDQTTVYFAYDAENMYFAFRAIDREPNRIKASVAARDGINADDWVCINLDAFGDQQSLYGLYVNPLGIQMDSRFAAGREDFGFDAVWYSAGRIDEQGYTIEVRVPFKSVRYGRGNPVKMRLIVERKVTRRSEDATYPPLDPKIGPNFLTQNIPIEFANINHYTLLEMLPDATYNRQLERVGEPLAKTGGGGEMGVTGKYGATAQLTLDGTYNPDFSQVEADAGQIDINRRYSLFFPEKRQFFLEGRDTFNLAGQDYSPLQYVVHTRTIENPIGGLKLAGKLGPKDTLATIYAVDEMSQAAQDAGSPEHAQVSILRYKRSLSQDSYAGGFYTGREQGDAFNRVFGGDASIRVSQGGALGVYAFGSTTQAQGATETKNGSALLGSYQQDTRKLGLYLGALDIAQDFETWTGYLTRSGVFEATAVAVPKFYPKSRVIRRIDLNLTSDHIHDAPSGLWEYFEQARLQFRLPGSTTFSVGGHASTEVFEGERFSTSGVAFNASSQVTKKVYLTGSLQHGNGIYYSADPFGGTATNASLLLRYQPFDQWLFELRGTYAGFARESDGTRLYDYAIYRGKAAFQANRYLFFRAIGEYNTYRHQLTTDFLASFTYIPGTVLHAGYGSLYEKAQWDGTRYVPGASLLETRRGFFLKASYLWRM